MFTQRKENVRIIFVGHHVPGQLIKQTVEDGDSVVLRIGNESVLVKDVQALGKSRFKGKVYGFEPSFALEYQGLKVDDEVEFEEKHIISCSS